MPSFKFCFNSLFLVGLNPICVVLLRHSLASSSCVIRDVLQILFAVSAHYVPRINVDASRRGCLLNGFDSCYCGQDLLDAPQKLRQILHSDATDCTGSVYEEFLSIYALCSHATCTMMPNVDPPMAECGCYAFEGASEGSSPSVLDKKVKVKTAKKCNVSGACTGDNVNKAPFCKQVNSNKVYKGRFEVVSIFSDNWPNASQQTIVCEQGGSLAICATAGCRFGTPSSSLINDNMFPAPNATCYCPVYTSTTPFDLSGPAGIELDCLSNTTSPPTGIIVYNGI
eukprot:gene15367-21451_t